MSGRAHPGSGGHRPAAPGGLGGGDGSPAPRRSASRPPGLNAGRPDGVLIVGYGNTLRCDDGVGVRTAEALAGDPRLAGAAVLAVHQLTPELALEMSRASLVLLIDASTDAPPGELTLRRLTGTVAPSSGGATPGDVGVSTHHVGPSELVELAGELYGAAPNVVVVSVGAATLDVGETLSPAVAAALPRVVEAVAGLVREHGRRR